MIVIMRLLFYNILILIFLPIAVGRILYKSIKDKDYRLNLSQRFGIYKINSSKKKVIWFHAVSLGEVIASEKIVNKLLEDADVILTVTTPTGLRHARKIYKDRLKICYAPWDSLAFMNRTIHSFKPSAIVIFETEIWPSMVHCSFKKDIPIKIDKKRFRPNKSEVNKLMGSNKKAKKLLNWKPKYSGTKNFYNGLKKTVEWYKINNNLPIFSKKSYEK